MVRRKLYEGSEEFVIKLVAYLFLIFLTIMCIIPLLRIITEAFSSEINVVSGNIGLIPVGFNFSAFQYVLNSPSFIDSLKLSFLATIVFTIVAMILTIMMAYPLSRPYLPGGRSLNLFIAFTLLFNGGIIPTYIIVKNLGIMNTFLALIIPHAISAFNIFILIAFMKTIPAAFEEAAKLEGASQFTILIKVIIPLCKPTLATLVLFYAVFRWNSWFDIVMYVSDRELYTLQVVLRNLLMASDNTIMKTTAPHTNPLISVQAASIIFTILPIVVLYPFLQKYYVKGLMVGGVKG